MPDEPSPRTLDRLTRSREALLTPHALRAKAMAAHDDVDWIPIAHKAAAHWWKRHPANAAMKLARPMLERYGRQQPGKLVLIAAATGAVTVLVKPWRLLSATALIAGLLKTSDVADLVTSVMHKK